MRAALITVTALAIRAQTPPDPTDVLAHARDNMVERAKRLPNYTCVQTVDREYFVRSTTTPPYASCDQMSAAAHKKLPLIDDSRHAVVAAPDPADRAFLGSRPFSAVNTALELRGRPAVYWQLFAG